MKLYHQMEQYAVTHQEQYQQLALDIFAHPETSNHEVYACQTLSTLLQKEGFVVEVAIAGHPTGFLGTYKAKKQGPVIGILCEYDALPHLGHACGHNIYAAVSMLSAITMKQVMEELGGEVRIFGTPCEEGGENANAKISYANAGLFDDVDAALSIHPSFYTRVSPPTLAIDGMVVEFHGRSSHSSNAPEKGINALDAAVMFYNGLSMMRQQSPDGLRFTAYFLDGGQAGSISDHASLHVGVAALHRQQANETMEKLEAIAHGAATAAFCKTTMTRRDRCDDEMILTPLLDERYMQYAKQVGAGNINEDYHGGLGATDVGNASQKMPTLHARLSISNTPITAHTIEFREASCSSYGLDQIVKGALALSYVGADLILQPTFLAAVKMQHEEHKKAAR